MAKLRHLALATADPEATATFYREAFGFREVAHVDTRFAAGIFLTDGTLNLAVLRFKDDQLGRGTDYVGLHHIGFVVEDLDETLRRLDALGARCLVGKPDEPQAFFEVKYVGPDGVVLDISEQPWPGARGLADEPAPDA